MSSATFLTDSQMRLLAQSGHAVVEPFDDRFLQPASYDLRLSDLHFKYKFADYTLGQEIAKSDYEHERFEELILEPGRSAFIGLAEAINVPQNCIGLVFPRSSVTRVGLCIPPVYMNPGYSGTMPITIINCTHVPVKILPRVRVAQLLLARLSSQANQAYDLDPASKYANEFVAPSRLHSDDEIRAALQQVIRESLPRQLLERA